MQKKILIALVHSTSNAGDLALLEMSILMLKKYFKEVDIIISANYPTEALLHNLGHEIVASPLSIIGKTQNMPLPFQLYRLMNGWCESQKITWKHSHWSRLISAYNQADLVVAIPGNLFFSTGKYGWPYPAQAFSVSLAHRFNKPFYVLPQSIGPFKRKWEKKILRNIYSPARQIFLRDNRSLQFAREIGLPMERVSYAPDPAFALEPENTENAIETLVRYGWLPNKPSVGVTVIPPMVRSLNINSINRYYKTLALTLENFSNSEDSQIVFFNQVTGPSAIEDDRLPTRVIYTQIKSNLPQKNILLIEDQLTPNMLKACYGHMDLFIASRLHSGIFSLGMKVPTIFIGYLSKTIGVLEMLNLQEFGLELENVDEYNLINLVLNTWNSKAEIRHKLEYLIPLVKQDTMKPAEIIYRDFTCGSCP
ncbi:MAG: polysaccharide pyruvyl transferase family protein [Bellilinea sp.]